MRKPCCFAVIAVFVLGLGPALSAQGRGENAADSPTEPDPAPVAIECIVSVTETTEPKNPYKKEDGYWDQGNIGGCVWTSLVNSNIQAGADDTGGKFARRFRRCLARKGHPNAWRRGVVVGSDQHKDMLACKKQARAAESIEVEFKNLLEDTTWEQKKKALSDALADGGAAVIYTKNTDGRHASSVISVDCTNNTVKIRDPNGGIYTLTIDANGKVTGVTPANSHYDGATVFGVTVECKTA